MGTKWAGAVALATAVMFAACASVAHADMTTNITDPGTVTSPPETVLAPDGSYGGFDQDVTTLVDTPLDPGIVNDAFTPTWHCRTASTQKTRKGVTGGFLWRFQRNRHWCYNGIRIKNVSTTYSTAVGTFWKYDGIVKRDYNESGCPNTSCWYYGSTTKSEFESLIPVPFTNITEHNKPWIRQTVFSDGHATATTNCGC